MIINILIFFSGFAFAEQSCPKGSHWVEAFKRNAYYRADGTFVSATRVKGHCRKNQSRRVELKDAFVSGTPRGWPHKNETPKKWKKHEIERVLDAFDELPKGLWPKTIGKIYRLSRSKTMGNPATSAENILAIYDVAFVSNKKLPLARVLAHELAHEIFRESTKEEKVAYGKVAGWLLDPRATNSSELVFYSYMDDSERVYEDGNHSIEESFANSIEAYLYDRARLKAKLPVLHNWVKKQYGDKLRMEPK